MHPNTQGEAQPREEARETLLVCACVCKALVVRCSMQHDAHMRAQPHSNGAVSDVLFDHVFN
jgi:hypothetical protein